MPSSSQLKPQGWDLYFPDEDCSMDSHIPPIVSQITQWFRTDGRALLRNVDYTGQFRVCFDFKELTQCPVEGFMWAIGERPKEALATIGCAAYEALFAGEEDTGDREELVDTPERKINVRILNWEPMTPMKYLKSNCIGKFVSVCGTVIRVSTIKPVLVAMNFVCGKCGYACLRHFPDGKYDPPSSCLGCKSKMLIPDRSTAITVDWQRVRLQEIVTDDSREEGRMPRTIECELSEDLVDLCVPGDEVTVSGVVKVVSTDGESSARAKNKCLFLLYIEANSISNPKKTAGARDEALQFNSRELEAVSQIARDRDPLRLIVNSVCPAIYGQEMVKLALCLSVFGGTPERPEAADDRNKLSVRSDPHVLVVGEPGLGKSQMLQAISGLAPRGVYVCGNTTSTAGLTVTVVKDAASGDFSLEAGALVLGDQGVCCIDEFDKMGGEQQALLEAMEQQSISVAKAGIVCSLSARCSVLAAANPIGGHYNRAKTVNENLKMPRAILSRFDVIFILLDDPDVDRDLLLSEHVMAMHSTRNARSGGPSQAPSVRPTPGPSSQRRRPVNLGEGLDHQGETLASRLQLQQGETLDTVPAALLRKYIAYARRYCFPKLSEDAKGVLQRFYTMLRKRNHTMDSTPITTRQLEALVRLAQARAKMELREVVSKQDAEEVVEMMKESLFDTFADDEGVVDFSRSSGSSKAKEVKRLKVLLYNVAEQECNNLFKEEDIHDIATSNGISGSMVAELIDTLNTIDQCLLKKGNRTWQLTGTNTTRPSQRPMSRGGGWGGRGGGGTPRGRGGGGLG